MDESAENNREARKHTGRGASGAPSTTERAAVDGAGDNIHPPAESDSAKDQGAARASTGPGPRSRAGRRNGPMAQIVAGIRLGGAAVDLVVYVVPALAMAWVICKAAGVGAGLEEGSTSAVWTMSAVVAASVLGAIGPDMGMQRGLGAHISGRKGKYAYSVLHSQGYRAELTHNAVAVLAVGVFVAPLAVYGRAGVAAAGALCGSYCMHLLVDWLTGRQPVTVVPGGRRQARLSGEATAALDDDSSSVTEGTDDDSNGDGQHGAEVESDEPEGSDGAVSFPVKER